MISDINNKNISIIILNYNGKHHLIECMESIKKYQNLFVQIILVDNNSIDGSQEYLMNYYPNIQLIFLNHNTGFSYGNNIGIHAAKGDYIVLLNNDTVVEPDWLENLYKCMTSDPSVGSCASKMVSYYDRNLLDTAGDGFSISGAAFKCGHMENEDQYCKDEYVFGACAGAAMYKREMLETIGLLDEDFFLLYEDADLSFRAQLAGYKCKYAADAVVYHKVRSSIGMLSDTHVFYGQRNVEYAYFKNMPAGLIPRTLWRHLLYNILAFGYFTLKGKGLIFLKAKWDFLKNFRKVLAKRKQVQSLKVVDDKYIWSILEKKWLSTRLKGK